jgi:hypothetical protein
MSPSILLVMRIAIGVLAGYLAMATLVLLTLVPATMLIDIDRLRDPATGIMTAWFVFVVEWPVSLFSAVLGGVIAAVVGGRAGREVTIRALAVFVLVVGGVAAAIEATGRMTGDRALVVEGELSGTDVEATEAEALAAREDVTTTSEAERLPIQPLWDAVSLPMIGALGVLLGGRVVQRAAAGLAVPTGVDANG